MQELCKEDWFRVDQHDALLNIIEIIDIIIQLEHLILAALSMTVACEHQLL